MKTVKWRKSFKKDYNKLDNNKKRAWAAALRLLYYDPKNKKLRRHKLKGKYKGLESIDITPDLRALFFENNNKFVFYYLKNHNQLYS
ncbi:type II toxin-antitoxin system YafQ family toxin [Patescibacteria group bacterium]|nr:type II toxin-antitoxin system YafQ family toxin [Patescibacteria group bacterium]MBU1683677.1 type II toxin-antitoxin system YafQ family toxin [Patescibacteria group bacterium]MBU1935439.1 type II toxin-antitoxin system YafQ family toxin [Patescibacteria group bacterium]